MPHYRYRAIHASGRLLRGKMEAANENQLAARLGEMGYEILGARAQWRLPGLARDGAPGKQMLLLFTQLAALAKAGVPLALCLEDSIAATPDGRLRDALRRIAEAMREGTDLADACALHPAVFSSMSVALLRAGMLGGDPAVAFAQLRDHIAWQTELRALLRRTLRYPLFLMVLSICVMGFMLTSVVPQLVEFLAAQEFDLPWHTRALIWTADRATTLIWLGPLLLAGGAAAIMLLRRLPAFALMSDRWLLRLPAIGAIVAAVERAHFLHHLALASSGGLPLLQAITVARAALTNRAIMAQADMMTEAVAHGQDLAQAMQALPDFAGTTARRVQIGLQSNSLPAQLREVSHDFDKEAAERCRQLAGALEPALTLAVGGLLAWIVTAVIGPLYASLNNLGYAP